MSLVYQLPFSPSQRGQHCNDETYLKFISVLILFLDGLVSTILLKNNIVMSSLQQCNILLKHNICYELITAM